MNPWKPFHRLLLIPACFLLALGMGAILQGQALAHSQPFATVPPPNATFPPPIQPVATGQPAFAPPDYRPSLNLGDRIGEAAGYLAGGVIGLALGGAALWLDRAKAPVVGVPRVGGLAKFGPGLTWFTFRPRLRRMT